MSDEQRNSLFFNESWLKLRFKSRALAMSLILRSSRATVLRNREKYDDKDINAHETMADRSLAYFIGSENRRGSKVSNFARY